MYGLAAALEPGAIELLFRAKGRPRAKAVAVLGASADDLRAVASFDARAEALARALRPGPLTLVLPRAPGFSLDLGGDPDAARSVAVRVPAHDAVVGLLRSSGPLAVTSANQSGEPPATTVEAASAALGTAASAHLDGGICDRPPSTIVSLVGRPQVLRRGELAPEKVLEALQE